MIPTSVKVISCEQAKSFCANLRVEEYQLVDVRQPEEYEEGHFPGALLLPLENLLNGEGELNPLLPTIVYCHSGFRSAAAAMGMLQKGFKEIYNIQEGFSNWAGPQVAGPLFDPLQLLPLEGDFHLALELAFALEQGTQILYQKLSEQTSNVKTKNLLYCLINLEERHKTKIAQRGKITQANIEVSKFNLGMLEGGYGIEQSAEQLLPYMDDPTALLSLAMGVEAQAFDFFMRLRSIEQDEDKRGFFTEMANEERGHLSMLARFLEAMLIQTKQER